LWGSVLVALTVAIGVGVIKLWDDVSRWRHDQERAKAPWERAQANHERDRAG